VPVGELGWVLKDIVAVHRALGRREPPEPWSVRKSGGPEVRKSRSSTPGG
jgi:hypothetical protein